MCIYIYRKFYFSLGIWHTLNKAASHAVMNLDLRKNCKLLKRPKGALKIADY